jgi:hypothetical protein
VQLFPDAALAGPNGPEARPLRTLGPNRGDAIQPFPQPHNSHKSSRVSTPLRVARKDPWTRSARWLDPYKAFITAMLEQYPRLRATRLWAMLRDRGYAGSAVQVRRYVRTVRPAARARPSSRSTRSSPVRCGH